MDRYTANRYIALKNQIAAGGGSVPQELIDEVEALDATVNGDETQEPPIVGLVDIVGDLENAVEDLDVTVNGDPTTTPATPGLVDIVQDLDLTVNGNSTTTPATPGLVDRVGDLEDRVSDLGFVKLWENSDPTQSFSTQNIELSSGDYDHRLIIYEQNSSGTQTGSVLTEKGTGAYLCNVYYSSGVGCNLRTITYTDATHYSVSDGRNNATTDNTQLIPLVIYGFN